MKASIINGTNKIQGFHDDDYSFNNPKHPDKLVKVKGFAKGIDMDEVTKNLTQESGVFKYFLDSKGIVQQLKIEEQKEFVDFQKRLIKQDLTNEADPLFFKAQRGEIDKQIWLDKVAEVRARYPYEEK